MRLLSLKHPDSIYLKFDIHRVEWASAVDFSINDFDANNEQKKKKQSQQFPPPPHLPKYRLHNINTLAYFIEKHLSSEVNGKILQLAWQPAPNLEATSSSSKF